MRKRWISWIAAGLALSWPFHLVQANTAEILFQTDFSDLDGWEEKYNGQLEVPGQPCRGPNGVPTWHVDENGVGVTIQESVPCILVLAAPGSWGDLESLDLQWNWQISDPNQDRNIALAWENEQTFFSLHAFGNRVYSDFLIDGQRQVWDQQGGLFPFQPNTLYQGRVQFSWQTKKLRVWMNQVLVLESTLLSDQKIPFRPGLMASVGYGNNSSEVFFTNFTIRKDGESMIFPAWKQSTEPWQSQVYDTAEKWSTEATTIGRWGCALTSAANVLAHFGVQHLPDRQPLDPGTLNTWLQDQPDGYLGPGLINWRAITRAAKWHSNTYGTPALEFSIEKVAESNKFAWLQQQLQRRQPIILEQPEHFVVATGTHQETITIHDPLFPKNTLEEYNNTFLSTRVFTPSYTNLQGGIFVTPGWFFPSFTTDTGLILNPEPLESLPYGWRAWNLPAWGNSNLNVINTLPLTAPLIGWTYDAQGQALAQNRLLAPFVPTSLTEEQEPTPTLFTFTDQDFARLLSWQEIRSPVIWKWHRQVEQRAAESMSESAITHYQWLLDRATAQGWLSDSSRTLLEFDAGLIGSLSVE